MIHLYVIPETFEPTAPQDDSQPPQLSVNLTNLSDPYSMAPPSYEEAPPSYEEALQLPSIK